MQLHFRDRLTLRYMIATAAIVMAAFGSVYFMVRQTLYANLDRTLRYEASTHDREVVLVQDSVRFVNKAEWEQREHRQVQVNPVFIQLTDPKGVLQDKSPNLKTNALRFNPDVEVTYFDALLDGRQIRQIQFPIVRDGNVWGYILAAISSEQAHALIVKLRTTLIASYCFILVVLYVVARWLAQQSISPIGQMTATLQRILSENNLKERLLLPRHRDELYQLASVFNVLLSRIERVLEREHQFTSDVSHELRTPLAALRGTLEVLIRKPRSPEEYEAKIRYGLSEIDRMTLIVEHLLLLARLEIPSRDALNRPSILLKQVIENTLERYRDAMTDKRITLQMESDGADQLAVPQYHAALILDNIVGNAIKYSPEGGSVCVEVTQRADSRVACAIRDEGIGIRPEDLGRLFENFFRAEPSFGTHRVAGYGLGLSIAKKSAEAINATIEVSSEWGKGACFTVLF